MYVCMYIHTVNTSASRMSPLLFRYSTVSSRFLFLVSRGKEGYANEPRSNWETSFKYGYGRVCLVYGLW